MFVYFQYFITISIIIISNELLFMSGNTDIIYFVKSKFDYNLIEKC